jgi:hypothetical protein
MLRIVWLLGFQDPIPDTADTGRHLMRMESEDKVGSEVKENSVELTMREMGSIFPETEEAERQGDNEKRKEGIEGKGVTSFGISQIVNKDCLPRAEDSVITELDTETKDNGISGRGKGTWSKGGRRTWSEGGRGTGSRGGGGRGEKACCTNTAARGTVAKTHFRAS